MVAPREKRPKPGPKPGPGPMRGTGKKRRRVPKKKTWDGHILDPGQKAALESKFNKSWHQTFTNISFFDSFKGPKGRK